LSLLKVQVLILVIFINIEWYILIINNFKEKLPELVAKDNSLESQSLSRLSATILSIKHENNDLNKPVEKKREFNDKTRIGILKGVFSFLVKFNNFFL
jgi:hypothetical protein